MFNDIEALYDDIIYATKNNLELFANLKKIKGATICVGVGGSKVVAKFAEKILAKKNKIIAITLEPGSLTHFNKDLYENIFISSHSGKNYGVKVCLNNNLKQYLFSTRKTPIKDEVLLTYDMIERQSFISLSDTIIPMAILLKFYLGKRFNKTIDKILKMLDKEIFLEANFPINIFTDVSSETSSTFLESTLIESGLNTPVINYKYDYCHGRSTINKSHDKEAIILGFSNTDLDKTLLKVLSKTTKKVLILKDISSDEIINDFYFTIASVYLTANIAKSKKINLKTINYDREAVHELYYFKGSM